MPAVELVLVTEAGMSWWGFSLMFGGVYVCERDGCFCLFPVARIWIQILICYRWYYSYQRIY